MYKQKLIQQRKLQQEKIYKQKIIQQKIYQQSQLNEKTKSIHKIISNYKKNISQTHLPKQLVKDLVLLSKNFNIIIT